MVDVEQTKRIEGTEALLVSELEKGRYYYCLLAKRNVLYIGNNTFTWYNADADVYKMDSARDYQFTEKKGEL